jgi:hypothetical protein
MRLQLPCCPPCSGSLPLFWWRGTRSSGAGSYGTSISRRGTAPRQAARDARGIGDPLSRWRVSAVRRVVAGENLWVSAGVGESAAGPSCSELTPRAGTRGRRLGSSRARPAHEVSRLRGVTTPEKRGWIVPVRIPPDCRPARVPGVHRHAPRIDSRHPGWLRVAGVGGRVVEVSDSVSEREVEDVPAASPSVACEMPVPPDHLDAVERRPENRIRPSSRARRADR